MSTTSEKKTDWLGNEYIQHYDENRNKIGTSETRKDWLGNEYVQHFDENRNKTGTSEARSDWMGDEYIQHFDEHRNKTGTSETRRDWLGNEYVQHFDESRNKTGTSEVREDWLGNQYVKHSSDNRAGNTIRSDIGSSADSYSPAYGGGSIVVTAVIVAACVLLYNAFAAWRSFVGRNESLLKVILEYVIPIITMIVIAVRTSAADHRLKTVGLLEGAITAGIICATQRFGLEVSGPLGDQYYASLTGLSSSTAATLLINLTFPFLMYLLIFALFPAMGFLFRRVCSSLDSNLQGIMREINPRRVNRTCKMTAVLFFAVFLTAELEEASSSLFIADMIFNGAFIALAASIMTWFSVKLLGK